MNRDRVKIWCHLPFKDGVELVGNAIHALQRFIKQHSVKFKRNAIAFALSRVVVVIHRCRRYNISRSILATRRKLSWFGHVCRHDTLPKTKLQGEVDDSRRGVRTIHRNRQANHCRRCCADDRSRWVAIALEKSVGVPKRRLGVMGVCLVCYQTRK